MRTRVQHVKTTQRICDKRIGMSLVIKTSSIHILKLLAEKTILKQNLRGTKYMKFVKNITNKKANEAPSLLSCPNIMSVAGQYLTS